VRTGTPLGLLSIDLDHFKSINDSHGHLAGDQVLRQVASVTQTTLRDGDVLVRMGGEEFLVLLPGAGPGDLCTIGERIRRTIAAATVPNGRTTLSVTASLGGACLSEAADDTIDQLLAAADEALYASKTSGRNRLTLGGAPPSSRCPTGPRT
jgi:diguanylate cyclase (GGDEF)-like protein